VPPGLSPTEVGINPNALNTDSGKVEPRPLAVMGFPSTPVVGLKTTAAPIIDTWSDENNPYKTEGGGTQFNIPNKDSFTIKSVKPTKP